MFAKVYSAGLLGVDGFLVEVEADVQNGLPGFYLTGALSTETKEAQYRIMNALKNSGLHTDPKKITVNFSPAFVRKEGTSYDLPVAVSVLSAMQVLDAAAFHDTAFFGETGLDGSLKRIRGALPLAFTLKERGFRRLIVPADNASEASLVEGIEVIGCRDLREVIQYLKGGIFPAVTQRGSSGYDEDEAKVKGGSADSTAMGSADPFPGKENPFPGENFPNQGCYTVDFSEVHGQAYLKRAAEIAVSGRHNILMSGPAGTGKTMIARRLPTILPALTRAEDIEISKVYSISGLLPSDQALLSKRPFRSPHHGISAAAFAGGGVNVMPGEISLASGGILFLDELPLFNRFVLELLRQPMEEHKITVTRMKGSFTYPADFMLCAAMNNCACGFYPDRGKCTCTRAQIKAYMGHLSKPLLERIDICAEARPIGYRELAGTHKEEPEESSAVIRERVERVFKLQQERFRGTDIGFNSRMGIREIETYCPLGKAEKAYMEEVYQQKGLSGRTYHKILKVARTIADMRGSAEIREADLKEAVSLRSIEDSLFKAGQQTRMQRRSSGSAWGKTAKPGKSSARGTKTAVTPKGLRKAAFAPEDGRNPRRKWERHMLSEPEVKG